MAGNSYNPTTMGSDGRPIAGYSAGDFNAQGQWQQKPDQPAAQPAPPTSPGASYGQQQATGIPGTSSGGAANQAAVAAAGPAMQAPVPHPTAQPHAGWMQPPRPHPQQGPIDAIQGLDQRQFARNPMAPSVSDNPVTPPQDDSLMPPENVPEYGIPHAQRPVRPTIVRA